MTAKANYSRANAVTDVIVPCAAVFGEIKTNDSQIFSVSCPFDLWILLSPFKVEKSIEWFHEVEK